MAGTSRRGPKSVVVLVDDAGYGDFGWHAHPFLKTPHMARPRGESVRLADFHGAPMCLPAGGKELTGVDGLRNGVTSITAGRMFLRPKSPAMPQRLAAALDAKAMALPIAAPGLTTAGLALKENAASGATSVTCSAGRPNGRTTLPAWLWDADGMDLSLRRASCPRPFRDTMRVNAYGKAERNPE